MTAALDELRSLHHADRLAEHYDRVPALLSGLSDEDSSVAARLLARVDRARVRELHPAIRPVRAVVLGHGTLVTLGTALGGQLARHGFLPHVRVAEFDSYVVDLADPGGDLYRDEPDLVVCVLDHTVIFDEVPVPFTVEHVTRVLTEKVATLRGLVERFRRNGRGTLVLNTIPLPREWAVRLLDHPARARLGAAWRAANAELLTLGERPGQVVVSDLDLLLTEGVPLVEPRFAAYVHANLSDAVLERYARELGHLWRARGGKAKKVLALDLDETLWGGVLGDDGVEGIEVGHTPRGEAFARFQETAKQLEAQGVLLAAVSKNDDETVRAALREHPDLRLRADDFTRIAASWGPKADSLRALASALNLGLDSVVFVDDSIQECAAVASELPAVTVIHVGDPALHTTALLADDWFATPEVTGEDRTRTRLYREEAARTDFLAAAGSVEQFLAGLDVTVRLGPVRDEEVPRIAQLTLRTNQFNLTTQRLDASEVARLAADAAHRVLAISSADRFGGNGTVGALFLRAVAGELVVDNFLLSCRVFARGIEQACLSVVLRAARDAGFAAVRATYLPTAKNGKVRELYQRYGFATDEETGTGPRHSRHDLAEIVAMPDHLELVADGDLMPNR